MKQAFRVAVVCGALPLVIGISIFLLWLIAAESIYELTLGTQPPASVGSFARDVFTIGAGWTMIVVGIGVGFLFALVVLVISVVYRGCAIPVAWKVVGAEQKGAWQPHWLKLLERLEDKVPAHWTVIVMSDRGLYAPWLYAKIVSLGWHPFMRINSGGNFCPDGKTQFLPVKSFAPKEGTRWRGRGTAFSTPSRASRSAR